MIKNLIIKLICQNSSSNWMVLLEKNTKILKNLKGVDEVVVLTSQKKNSHRKISSLHEIKD